MITSARFDLAQLMVDAVVASNVPLEVKFKQLVDLEPAIVRMGRMGLSSMKPIARMTADDLIS